MPAGGFLLAACALILLSATTQTTLVRANEIISKNWRPTYDLVVLPPQAKVPADQRAAADLLAGHGGGISVQQYEQIKQLPGIEIAAPIAYVGYIRMPTPALYFTLPGFQSGYYQLDYVLTAFNGQRQIVETQQTEVVYISSGSDTGLVTDTTSQQVPDILQALGGQLSMVLK